MVPHPLFHAIAIPEEALLSPWRLTKLTEADLEEDWQAVSRSASRLEGFFPGWPGGITKEENRLDLAHHHVEFASRRSYAWVIRQGDGRYVGCAYVQPGWDPAAPIDAPFWFREGEEAAEPAFSEAWRQWLAEPPWPAMTVTVRAPSLP
ncbi:MAG: hypothetical protein AAGF76_12915 [Pseudomonadota bacterium]